MFVADSLGNLRIFIAFLNKVSQSDSAQRYECHFRTGKQGNEDNADYYYNYSNA